MRASITHSPPRLANVIRGQVLESAHCGSAIVSDVDGVIQLELGDIEQSVYPRSAIKLFQTIPLIESGAADSYALTDTEIALACASHNAEAFHLSAIEAWLNRLNLSHEDLESGPTLPLHEPTAHALIASGEKPTRVHQNCSGKHTGMLAMAKHLSAPTKGYSEYNHPTQRLWMQTFSEIIGIDARSLPWERDGCGLPAICMPLDKLAYGFAQFANLQGKTDSRAKAMSRIIEAIRQHPEMIAGTERCCTAVIRETQGKVIVKTGAEGVYGGFVPEMGIGFALKIDDGARRGSEVALGALLKKLGAIDDATYQRLKDYFEPDIVNSQGYVTGKVVPSEIWLN